MLMNSVIPHKFPRLVTLFLAWAWAWIALGVGINAFVKSNKDKSAIKNQVPPPTTVSINTNDVFRAGVVVTTVSALIAVISTIYIGLLLFDSGRRSGISTRTLTVQYATLGFLAVWLFATQIPVTVFVATHSVQVSASIDGLTLGNGIVKTIEKALGAKTAYKDYNYLVLLAVLPWFTILFTLIAAVVSFLASSHARRTTSTKAAPVSSLGQVDSMTPATAPHNLSQQPA
ncbi:hypothetical protein DFH07DRAFT_897770 [Mycena maculata]|uniref:Uncharacterized protein n=1 Tax=Mycena maculata TaxID=230809 RepID=A0AAD7MLZ9_9AGAR|nr:hypothetical protein DFH07DRAFT_897770 [Mycena maculata]